MLFSKAPQNKGGFTKHTAMLQKYNQIVYLLLTPQIILTG
ncbi:hypothetical protein BVAVS116_O0029 (plasmid) [Borreliella valaisiana VS116]|uniref:Uncharacterized protein n=1 Tax=Borreliella valaisiana VS116 TaxID=445987 RepID=C0R8D9_BORVA|nr:hypothetical protein BVAVS116_O0029 [Borreliella valaisiana VS116]